MNSLNDLEEVDTIGMVRKKSSNVVKTCTLIIEGMTCAAC
jgi:endonuclease III